MGAALKELGRVDEAIGRLPPGPWLQENARKPTTISLSSLRERDRIDEAVAAYRRALELKPDYAEAHTIWATPCKSKTSSTRPWPATGGPWNSSRTCRGPLQPGQRP